MTRRQLIKLYRRADPHDHFYSWEEIVVAVRGQHPEWTAAEVERDAEYWFKQCQRLEAQWFRSQLRARDLSVLSDNPHATAQSAKKRKKSASDGYQKPSRNIGKSRERF